MTEFSGRRSWAEELASLVEESAIRYSSPADEAMGISTPAFDSKRSEWGGESELGESESFRDQMKGFGKAWGEIIVEFGRGCKDVVQQTVLTNDSFILKNTKGTFEKVCGRLRFLNEFLPEDRDPVLAWPVVFLVFILAFAALNVNSKHDASLGLTVVKKVCIHPPTAMRILLPDGRRMAYRELGLTADTARFSLIAPHSFLSSRLAGIPGIKVSLLQEFGVRLVTYDLPGFGESDPHPNRSLSSSALDILHLADAVAVTDKFWLVGYSTGAMHAWAALKHIPNRIAGAAMFGPMVNPYQSGMTREELSGSWEKWVWRRKLKFYLARRFPKFLSHSYRQTFLSGKHGQIDKWLSLSLGKKDKSLIEGPAFEAFWHRDVEESIRQGSTKPFIEEASLLVSDWGFRLADLQLQKKCPRKGFFSWFKFMYRQPECQLTGYPGPIHIWQGLDDHVVPPSMIDYITRVLPSAIVHKLPEDGHFSYFFKCDECHRQILSTLFGGPLGPLVDTERISLKGKVEEADNLS